MSSLPAKDPLDAIQDLTLEQLSAEAQPLRERLNRFRVALGRHFVDKQALVDLIAERFGYVERAWEIKLGAQQQANVPWRNQQVFDRVRARATERGVPPDLCEALWRQMVGWFIQYEEEKLRDKIERKG